MGLDKKLTRIGFGIYDGYVSEHAPKLKRDPTEAFEQKRLWIIYGGNGTCDGCGKSTIVHLFDGMWLCIDCLRATIDERYSQEVRA